MQRHLKTSPLHHELKHNEGFINNDPESPALLSLALVNWTIVRSVFAQCHHVFISCQLRFSCLYRLQFSLTLLF